MAQKGVTVVVLMMVLIVAVIAAVGLMKSATGDVVRNTGHLPRQHCDCTVEFFDYYGNAIGTEVHSIRGTSNCDTRCDAHFGKSKRGRKRVIGALHTSAS